MRLVHHAETKDFAFLCGFCPERFKNKNELLNHRFEHLQKAGKNHDGFNEVTSAHKRKCQLLRMFFPQSIQFLDAAQAYIKPRLAKLLHNKQVLHSFFKAAFTLQIEMVKITDQAEIESIIITPFRTQMFTIKRFDKIHDIIDEGMESIFTTIDEFLHRGSGWSLSEILNLDVEFADCKPLSGSCGLHSVVYEKNALRLKSDGFEAEERSWQPSKEEKEKLKPIYRGVENARKNHDCFYLAIARHFTGSRGDSDRSLLHRFIQNSLTTEKEGPVALDEIDEFEYEHCDLDLGINVVFQDENNQV